MNIKINNLVVKYNGRIVGYLKVLDNLSIGFQYDNEWISNGFSISPLSLPLSHKMYIANKDKFDGLYGVFNDSLPDCWGKFVLQKTLLKQEINYDDLSPLIKLTLISENGLGALTYEPCQMNDDENYVDLDAIMLDCKNALKSKNICNIDKLCSLCGSSNGAIPKAHIKINNDYWIVKFPFLYDSKNTCLKEYISNEMAKKCGLRVNEFALLPSKKSKGYFASKRFDRIDGKRVHVISLSALLETSHRYSNLDYMHLFQVTKLICKDKEELYEVYRRMCFNVLYGNLDDHGKNFAYIYDEDKKSYYLSPFYDITKTNNQSEHEMTVLGNGNPGIDDLIEIIDKVQLSKDKCLKILNKIKRVLS